MPQTPTPVTLNEIAKRGNVSRSTVSLALRDHPKISAPVRARLKQIARELGYKPNPLVAAHMAHLRAVHPHYTGQCIAFVCNRSLREVEADTKTPVRYYYRGAKERAAELGFEFEFFNLRDHGMTGRRLSQILTARGICGVIIPPLSEGRGVSDVTLDWDSFALATIEHTFLEPRLHKVCNDEFSTIGRTVQHLLDHGFSRIGIAMQSKMDDHANHFWLAGYQAFQALAEPEHRVPHFITSDWTREAFAKWFNQWKPEAIITINDDIVRWLRDLGQRVPEDVSCVTLYWKEDRPHLSGFYQNHELSAAGAVDLVAAQLNRNERGLPAAPKTMLTQAVWRDGLTLRSKTAPARADLRVWMR